MVSILFFQVLFSALLCCEKINDSAQELHPGQGNTNDQRISTGNPHRTSHGKRNESLLEARKRIQSRSKQKPVQIENTFDLAQEENIDQSTSVTLQCEDSDESDFGLNFLSRIIDFSSRILDFLRSFERIGNKIAEGLGCDHEKLEKKLEFLNAESEVIKEGIGEQFGETTRIIKGKLEGLENLINESENISRSTVKLNEEVFDYNKCAFQLNKAINEFDSLENPGHDELICSDKKKVESLYKELSDRKRKLRDAKNDIKIKQVKLNSECELTTQVKNMIYLQKSILDEKMKQLEQLKKECDRKRAEKTNIDDISREIIPHTSSARSLSNALSVNPKKKSRRKLSRTSNFYVKNDYVDDSSKKPYPKYIPLQDQNAYQILTWVEFFKSFQNEVMILFDLENVLIKANSSVLDLEKQEHFKYLRDFYGESFNELEFGEGDLNMIARDLQIHDGNLDPGYLYTNVISKIDYSNHIQKNEKLKKFLDSIKADKLILTNSSEGRTSAILNSLGIRKCFGGIFYPNQMVRNFAHLQNSSTPFFLNSIINPDGRKKVVFLTGNAKHFKIMNDGGIESILLQNSEEESMEAMLEGVLRQNGLDIILQ